jgi:HD-GYP domain-containing protein (c-di-GMP phosphodiesterase class II)
LVKSDVPHGTAVLSNIIFLADRIDTLVDWKNELILDRDRIVGVVSELSGTFFNPDMVAVLKKKSAVEVFWLSLLPRHLPWALSRFRPSGDLELGLVDLEKMSAIFARIVDNKSPFTMDHSYGVARLCHFFGQRMRLEPETVQKLRISGLVHDLGKLSIPDDILEKPSALSPNEFQIIKRHPFETYYILSGLTALADIRDWASFHHEKADGSGYPFHVTGSRMGLEHLIVMLSDVIQALIQDRPYRPGLGRDQVLDILSHLATQQSSLQPLVDEVRKDYDLVAEVARGMEI